MSDETIRDDLANHAIACDQPGTCLICRARAEMERRAGDVDAIRFERDDARSRVALFYSALTKTLTPLMNTAQQIVQGEGIPLEDGIGNEPPRVPDEVFDRIQDAAERAVELRYVERQLAAATARLERFRSLHAQYAARAALADIGAQPRRSAYLFAELLATAWHGTAEWSGNPLDALEDVPIRFTVPGPLPATREETPDA